MAEALDPLVVETYTKRAAYAKALVTELALTQAAADAKALAAYPMQTESRINIQRDPHNSQRLRWKYNAEGDRILWSMRPVVVGTDGAQTLGPWGKWEKDLNNLDLSAARVQLFRTLITSPTVVVTRDTPKED